MDAKRIMVVEDEGITAVRLQGLLKDMGYTVTSMEVTGEAAVIKAAEHKPDLVLMDITLVGKMDGIEAAGQIRSRFNIPVVYLTAHSDEAILKRIKTTEPFGYVVKPFNENELRVTIEIALYKDTIERQLKKQNELLNNVLESLTHPFFVINVDDYAIKLANSAARQTGLPWADTCYALTHRRNRPCDNAEHPCVINKIKEERKAVTVEHIHYDREGNTCIVEVHGYPVFDKQGNITQIIEYNLDITERKKLEKRLEDAAITDELTGLFNRRGFFTLGEQQCRLADRHNNRMSLLYLDLDGFKNINDELGHKAGDEALIDTADILKKTFRKSDIIARIGGDEFAVLLTEPSETHVEQVVIGHVKETFRLHNEQGGRKYELLISIGMVHYEPERPCSIDILLSKADALMYEDKRYHQIEVKVNHLNEQGKPERRADKRFSAGDKCQATLDVPGMVEIKDISSGGVRLNTSVPLTTNNIYKIKISPGSGEEIALTAEVVRSSMIKSGEGKACKFLYEAGLKFIVSDNSLKISIDRLFGSQDRSNN